MVAISICNYCGAFSPFSCTCADLACLDLTQFEGVYSLMTHSSLREITLGYLRNPGSLSSMSECLTLGTPSA